MHFYNILLPGSGPDLRLAQLGAQQISSPLPPFYLMMKAECNFQIIVIYNLNDGQSPKEKFYVSSSLAL
jgi:hypothetical protein